MFKKVTVILIIICMLIPLSSCNREDTTQLAKDEFAKYHVDNDVVVKITDYLYFDTYTLKIDEIIEGTAIQNTSVIIEDKVYISNVTNGKVFQVYQCDLYGKNIELVFEKKTDGTSPKVYENDGNEFLIEYRKDSKEVIDSYNVLTGEYKNLHTGEDRKLDDFKYKEESIYEITFHKNPNYISHSDNYIEIYNKETGKTKVIRYDDFENTVCIESMKKFGYGIRRVDISKNHILVSCEIGAGDGWNAPHLIFEYDFETEALEYKCLVFPYEATIYRVQYLDN